MLIIVGCGNLLKYQTIMPIKDPQKRREYQKNWVSKKRSRQNNVEPNQNNFVEPLKKGWTLTKCFYCPQKMPMEKKYIPYFAPICPDCLPRHQEEEEKLEE